MKTHPLWFTSTKSPYTRLCNKLGNSLAVYKELRIQPNPFLFSQQLAIRFRVAELFCLPVFTVENVLGKKPYQRQRSPTDKLLKKHYSLPRFILSSMFINILRLSLLNRPRFLSMFYNRS